MAHAHRHPNVVHLDDLEILTDETGTRFGYSARQVSLHAGAKSIGCTFYEIPPGRTAFPFHCHHANEESIFVLHGRGTLRIGDQRIEVGAGDYAAFPVGREHAHQLINTGDEPLRYLCLSTMLPVDIYEYPDAGKVGAAAYPPGDDDAVFRGFFRMADAVDYLDGEPLD